MWNLSLVHDTDPVTLSFDANTAVLEYNSVKMIPMFYLWAKPRLCGQPVSLRIGISKVENEVAHKLQIDAIY